MMIFSGMVNLASFERLWYSLYSTVQPGGNYGNEQHCGLDEKGGHSELLKYVG
jgi:hypothetical protein